MSVESETDKQCPNCKAWYAEYERMRLALATARAACGEAAKVIERLSRGEQDIGDKLLVRQLRAIAAGKEAT